MIRGRSGKTQRQEMSPTAGPLRGIVESRAQRGLPVAVIVPSTKAVAAPARATSLSAALATGAGVGLLGGLIGLGGAEFRLPLLIGPFGFAARQAVIMNKAIGLIVVVTALPARLVVSPFDTVSGYWFVVVNLLAGSLMGAWIGATSGYPNVLSNPLPVLAVLLVFIAIALAWNHFGDLKPSRAGSRRSDLLGLAADVGIGIVAALMAVAGGELLIPTIVLLFAVSRSSSCLRSRSGATTDNQILSLRDARCRRAGASTARGRIEQLAPRKTDDLRTT
jgi:hypothetical protein